MNATDILALLAVIVLILQNAARVPAALAELLDACRPVVHAARALVATIKNTSHPSTRTDTDDDIDIDDDLPRDPTA